MEEVSSGEGLGLAITTAYSPASAFAEAGRFICVMRGMPALNLGRFGDEPEANLGIDSVQ